MTNMHINKTRAPEIELRCFCKPLFLLCYRRFPLLQGSFISIYVNIKENYTSPPTASVVPSLSNANANCCPTSSNWLSTFSDTFRPNLWISALLFLSHSNHLHEQFIISGYNVSQLKITKVHLCGKKKFNYFLNEISIEHVDHPLSLVISSRGYISKASGYSKFIWSKLEWVGCQPSDQCYSLLV